MLTIEIDALMRISYLHLLLGNFNKAEEISSQISEKTLILNKRLGKEKFQQKMVEALCYQSFLLFQIGKNKQAEEPLALIRAQYNFDDPYGKLLQVSMNYERSLIHRKDRAHYSNFCFNLYNKKGSLLKGIIHDAKNVLKSDESNYFAAMILGISLAERSHLSKAWKVFSLLLENCEQDEIFRKNSATLAALMVS